MFNLTSEQWLMALQIITNGGVILAAIKVTKYMSEINFKVNMMWHVFEQKFERRGDNFLSWREKEESK
jgi:hypothetical protein